MDLRVAVLSELLLGMFDRGGVTCKCLLLSRFVVLPGALDISFYGDVR